MAEHRLTRLVQMDLRQVRYQGRLKTKTQLLLTATVVNLTCLWAQVLDRGVPWDPQTVLIRETTRWPPPWAGSRASQLLTGPAPTIAVRRRGHRPPRRAGRNGLPKTPFPFGLLVMFRFISRQGGA